MVNFWKLLLFSLYQVYPQTLVLGTVAVGFGYPVIVIQKNSGPLRHPASCPKIDRTRSAKVTSVAPTRTKYANIVVRFLLLQSLENLWPFQNPPHHEWPMLEKLSKLARGIRLRDLLHTNYTHQHTNLSQQVEG